MSGVPGERRTLFSYPNDASLYLTLPGDNPTPFSLLIPGYNTPEQFRIAFDALERRRPDYVIVGVLSLGPKDPLMKFLEGRYVRHTGARPRGPRLRVHAGAAVSRRRPRPSRVPGFLVGRADRPTRRPRCDALRQAETEGRAPAWAAYVDVEARTDVAEERQSRRVDAGARLCTILAGLSDERKSLAMAKGWRPVPPWAFVTRNGTRRGPTIGDRGGAPRGMRRQDAVVEEHVDARPRRQRGQPLEQSERLEAQVGGAVLVTEQAKDSANVRDGRSVSLRGKRRSIAPSMKRYPRSGSAHRAGAARPQRSGDDDALRPPLAGAEAAAVAKLAAALEAPSPAAEPVQAVINAPTAPRPAAVPARFRHAPSGQQTPAKRKYMEGRRLGE